MRNRFLDALALLLLGAMLLSPASVLADDVAGALRGETNRMNVLMIVVDDMRTDLGCYGHPIVKSPNLDGLAASGTLFRRAYCQQAVCNSSRASMLTGLSVDRLGIYDLRTHFRDRFPDVVTLPQQFKRAGYQTHGIGKVFHNYHQDAWKGDAVSWTSPQQFHYGTHSADKPKIETADLPVDAEPMPRAERREVADEAYLDGRIAAAAVSRLRRVGDQRFFMAVGFWKPHLPFNAPAKYWDMYDRADVKMPNNPQAPKGVPSAALHESSELLRSFKRELTDEETRTLRHGYYAAISYVDAQIGKVLGELDRLQLSEKTIVVFVSDHGFHLGEHSLWCKNSNFELDARVPLVMRVPGSRRVRSIDALVQLNDIYPTVVDFCGIDSPSPLDGISLRSVLDGSKDSARQCALTQNPRPAYFGKDASPEVMGHSIRTEDFRFTRWRNLSDNAVIGRELYDHRTDPHETVNLVDRPSRQAVVFEHESLLESLVEKSRAQ